MPNNPDFQRFAVLDYEGVLQMASTIFAYVENTYVRRSVYESDIATLTSRVDAVDAVNRYEFDLDPQTGQLTFTQDNDGILYLTVN